MVKFTQGWVRARARRLVDVVEGELRHVGDEDGVEGRGDAEIVCRTQGPPAQLEETEARDGGAYFCLSKKEYTAKKSF